MPRNDELLTGMFVVLYGEVLVRYSLPIWNLVCYPNLYNTRVNVLVCYGASCTDMKGMIRWPELYEGKIRV
jgi:hypothetical protein